MTSEEAIAKVRELVAADHAMAIAAVEAVIAEAARTKADADKYGVTNPRYWAGMTNHAGRVEEALEAACGLMDDPEDAS